MKYRMNHEEQFKKVLENLLLEEQKEYVAKSESKLEENIKQYERVNRTALSERERHIYSAAYWIGKMDGRVER